VQQKKPGILEQIFCEFESFKISRRKAGEAMRRVRTWFCHEFRASEPLPPEFKELESQIDIEKNRARDLWQKHF
jgi:hypothetical protein